ncbi:hypothetical protein MMC11_007904 [Xylographa trunciseda]|nr:hypothetical protein [Xylographa trunciseda]
MEWEPESFNNSGHYERENNGYNGNSNNNNNNYRNNNNNNHNDGIYDEIVVLNIETSNVFRNRGADDAAREFKSFVEKSQLRGTRILRWDWEGGKLVLDVHPDSSDRLAGLSCEFSGVQILCELRERVNRDGNPAPLFNADEIARMQIMIRRRYTSHDNVLNLSSLAKDQDLDNLYLRNRASFFRELMQICQNLFQNGTAYTARIIDLSSNNLTDLDLISTFTQTFPNLIGLSLAHNSFMTTEPLSQWGRELQELEGLDLNGNPFLTRSPTWRDDILQWYPRLTHLNGAPVGPLGGARTARTARETVVPILPLAHVPQDNTKAEIFIRHFFPRYDEDRSSLIAQYYGADSTFSLVINQAGLVAPGHPPASWEHYTKRRNIIKLSYVPVGRLEASKGTQKIRECWNALPNTLHPDVNYELFKYRYDVESYVPTSVPQALLITVRGEFQEVNHSIRDTTVQRSFDRTFIIEPTTGQYEFQIVSDILVISPYAGDNVRLPTDEKPISYQRTMATPYMEKIKNYVVDLHIPPLFGAHAAGKEEGQVLKEKRAIELSRATRMKLGTCIDFLQPDWRIPDALNLIDRQRVATRPAKLIVLI